MSAGRFVTAARAAARCPVDSWGRVKGAYGLYVNDASVLCGAPTVNPQGSIMAVAHRNVLHLLDEM